MDSSVRKILSAVASAALLSLVAGCMDESGMDAPAADAANDAFVTSLADEGGEVIATEYQVPTYLGGELNPRRGVTYTYSFTTWWNTSTSDFAKIHVAWGDGTFSTMGISTPGQVVSCTKTWWGLGAFETRTKGYYHIPYTPNYWESLWSAAIPVNVWTLPQKPQYLAPAE